MRLFLKLFLTAVLLAIPMAGQSEMIVRNYIPARHDRFYSGIDKDFVGASYDFSGVGMSSAGNWATLVTDNSFLSSCHRHPVPGETVTFWATNDLSGPKYTYTVKGGEQIGMSDLWLGWFDSTVTVNTSIVRYQVPVLVAKKDYIGLELYNYGMQHRVGRNVLDKIVPLQVGSTIGLTAVYDYDNRDASSVGGDETCLKAGDSGAPSFAVLNSRLVFVGTHWAVSHNPFGSIDTFIPVYIEQINKVLARMGQSLSRYRSLTNVGR